MLDLKYCPSPRISPERASRLLHKNTNRSYRCLVICVTVNCSMGSTRHRSLSLLIWPTRRYPHCFIPFSLSLSRSHLPSNPEQDSGFCTPQDTKNKIITPVHLDMRFKISRYKGNWRDRRPNSQQPTVISARCPQHRESEKATDSKNILIRHTAIFRPLFSHQCVEAAAARQPAVPTARILHCNYLQLFSFQLQATTNQQRPILTYWTGGASYFFALAWLGAFS